MNDLKLVSEIEKERKQMLHLSKQYSLTSPQVITSSQKLDTLLARYQSEIYKKVI